MTLHVGLLGGNLVVQAGDRLLTQKEGKRLKPWEEVANKSLILLATNATAIISYAGLAHIDRMPTDQWLAEKITATKSPPPRRPGGSPPMQFGANAPIHLRQAIDRIKSGVAREFSKQPSRSRDNGLEVLITGYTFKRFRHPNNFHPRPFYAVLAYDKMNPPGYLHEENSLRHWPWNRESFIASIGNSPAGVIARAAVAQGIATGLPSMSSIEHNLRDAIRASARSPVGDGIGEECMVISIERIQQKVRACFMRADRTNTPFNTAYTPWIIGGGIILPPQHYSSPGFRPGVAAGGREIEFASDPPLTAVRIASMISQTRKKFP